MISTLILSSVENALNLALSLDAEISASIFAQKGRVLHIQISDLSADIFMRIGQDRIYLSPCFDGESDAKVMGRSFALLKQLSQDGVDVGGGVEFEGDLDFAGSIIGLFKSYRIDWEELLSKAVGDAMANKVGQVARDLQEWLNDSRKRFGMDVSEYIQEEARLSPTPIEVEAFIQDVSALRDAVERAEARVARLEAKRAQPRES